MSTVTGFTEKAFWMHVSETWFMGASFIKVSERPIPSFTWWLSSYFKLNNVLSCLFLSSSNNVQRWLLQCDPRQEGSGMAVLRVWTMSGAGTPGTLGACTIQGQGGGGFGPVSLCISGLAMTGVIRFDSTLLWWWRALHWLRAVVGRMFDCYLSRPTK